LGEKQLGIIREIINDPQISIVELSQRIGLCTTDIKNNIAKFKEKGILKRVGSAKGGHWEIDPELANNLNKT
jgi:ATP-dependent DNA helicase RecG